MRISDWSSDLCSSDIAVERRLASGVCERCGSSFNPATQHVRRAAAPPCRGDRRPEPGVRRRGRSEEHTSELQSLMRISYAVFCLTKKNKKNIMKTTAKQIDTRINKYKHSRSYTTTNKQG